MILLQLHRIAVTQPEVGEPRPIFPTAPGGTVFIFLPLLMIEPVAVGTKECAKVVLTSGQIVMVFESFEEIARAMQRLGQSPRLVVPGQS